MRLHELLAGLDVVEVRGESRVDVQSVVHDSRDVAPGALFCCIPGANVDGHDFAPAAVAAGAVACLVERPLAIDVTQVHVPLVRAAMGPIASRFHGEPSRSIRVIGVTGTNGKTTTTYVLEQIGRAAGERSGLVGTTGARMGDMTFPLRHTTPEATDLQELLARMRADGARGVAMEVSSHALDQHRVDGTTFAAVAFTNLSHDHLDYHGTIEAYFNAKARLFTREFTTTGAVNADDAHGATLAARATAAGVAVTTYGIDTPADVRATGITMSTSGTSFTIEHDGAPVEVHSPLVGVFNVANLLAAFTSARLAGVPPDAIAAGLSAPVVVPGRMERVESGQPFTVLVDYAHTPDALTSALGAARTLVGPGGRLVVVFGCGGDRDRAKRPVMGRAAVAGSDIAILTSDNPRSENPAAIARDVLDGLDAAGTVPVVELDRRRAIRRALQAAHDGDVVVIAGKGHESGQTANGVTVPFDDRVVAREVLEARA